MTEFDPGRFAGNAVAAVLTLIVCAALLTAGWRLIVWIAP